VSLGLAANEHVLVVVNKNADPSHYQASKDASGFAPSSSPSYTSYVVSANGTLAQSSHVVTGPYNASPSQAAISADGNFFFDAEFFSMRLRSYQIGAGGTLTEAPGSPVQLDSSVFPPGITPFMPAPIPLGLLVYPSKTQLLLYVDFPVVPGLGVFSYDSSGKLTFVRSAPHIGNPGTVVAACWLAMTPNRKTLYSANTGTNNITVFNTSKPAQPRPIQLVTAKGTSNLTEMAVDNTGTYLFVVGGRLADAVPAGEGNILHVFRIAKSGKITELASSPTSLGVPADTGAMGILVIRK
jgi:6-phosphogluconolactonase (cycloisomerase 2 family)